MVSLAIKVLTSSGADQLSVPHSFDPHLQPLIGIPISMQTERKIVIGEGLREELRYTAVDRSFRATLLGRGMRGIRYD